MSEKLAFARVGVESYAIDVKRRDFLLSIDADEQEIAPPAGIEGCP